MTEENEQTIFKEIHELIAAMENNVNKRSKFVQLFQERADENAMKIWTQCFEEIYGKQND
jgi:hypothetical protein